MKLTKVLYSIIFSLVIINNQFCIAADDEEQENEHGPDGGEPGVGGAGQEQGPEQGQGDRPGQGQEKGPEVPTRVGCNFIDRDDIGIPPFSRTKKEGEACTLTLDPRGDMFLYACDGQSDPANFPFSAKSDGEVIDFLGLFNSSNTINISNRFLNNPYVYFIITGEYNTPFQVSCDCIKADGTRETMIVKSGFKASGIVGLLFVLAAVVGSRGSSVGGFAKRFRKRLKVDLESHDNTNSNKIESSSDFTQDSIKKQEIKLEDSTPVKLEPYSTSIDSKSDLKSEVLNKEKIKTEILNKDKFKTATSIKEKLKRDIISVFKLSCGPSNYKIDVDYFEEKFVLRTADTILLLCQKLNLSLPTLLTALVYLQLYRNSSKTWITSNKSDSGKTTLSRRVVSKSDEQFLTASACVLLSWKYKEDEIGLIKSTRKLFDISTTVYKVIVSQNSRFTSIPSVSSWMLQDDGEEMKNLKSQILDRENQLLHSLDYFIGPIPLPDLLVGPYVRLFLVSVSNEFTELQDFAKKLQEVVLLLVIDIYKTQMCVNYTPDELVAISIIKACCLLSFADEKYDIFKFNFESGDFNKKSRGNRILHNIS
ncbi:uncharacterized protein TA06320 [Theileria annulata]|uniref:6-Cys domain-containing protein n=1 Tax=Theileria annulata TaxID=5874 RepID=Q4UI97_THEAN|nr:uncharacterized protein TA06320 [Theileria annulata]CAI73192.1 hypothetical protein, conserved [Theileria annulata]|eukprot:XP_953870.1 hypothetical protein, conserved [Theileria annulata]